MSKADHALFAAGLGLIGLAAIVWVATGVQSFLFVMAGLLLIALAAIRGMDRAMTTPTPEGEADK